MRCYMQVESFGTPRKTPQYQRGTGSPLAIWNRELIRCYMQVQSFGTSRKTLQYQRGTDSPLTLWNGDLMRCYAGSELRHAKEDTAIPTWHGQSPLPVGEG
ncbi:hypothetical protein CRN79_26025 [Serratia fonticola]|nr:hypothetical protein CRN79_26025 [Serratia fonticola]